MGLSALEQEVVDRIDAAAMLRNTVRWAGINSGTRNRAGLDRMAAELADALAALPGPVAMVEPDRVENVGADGRVVPVEHGRHLHLAVRPHAPVQLLLTGHMDTVYPADHPFQQVEMRSDGTLAGPGTADMKGGLAVMIEALAAIERSGAGSRIGYDLVVNSDEETGSFSSAALLTRAARGKVAGLTYEPALPDGTLAGARGGTGNFSLVVRGRSAHAGRNPEEGRNAIVAAADLALRLAAAAGPGLSVNPARIEGGGPNNVVPELAVLRVNLRPSDHAAIERGRAALADIAATIAAQHEVVVEQHGRFNRPPKPMDAKAERLFAAVRDAGAALGQPIAWRATGGVCDGNTIAATGVPVVDTMGVRGGAIHSADEFMVVDSLAERAALSAVTMLRLAGPDA